ncbi:MAG: hypothetical protein J6C19_07975 [Lachnospiraceae bacterium]|nr:hypothetical protein [Lachnospiraceae bacterium]MBO5145455.1 hypothetical protein [Lachnospiraceae bacterium]
MKQIMYLGPGIKGIVRRNQIFTYWPETVIGQACAFSPLAKYLFVPMDNIVQCKKELRKQGSFLNLVYQKIEKQEAEKENDRL